MNDIIPKRGGGWHKGRESSFERVGSFEKVRAIQNTYLILPLVLEDGGYLYMVYKSFYF